MTNVRVIKALKINISILFKKIKILYIVLFYFFVIIDLYVLILAVIIQIFNETAKLYFPQELQRQK